MENKGKLFLIPVMLGDESPQQVIPAYNTQVINGIDEFVAENARSARRALKAMGYTGDFDKTIIHILDKRTPAKEISGFLATAATGKDIGLLSEAGNPCIADPGNELVKIAHKKGITVIPLVGPGSIMMALIASGFNGQSFVFHGYLPIERKDRQQKLRELKSNIIQHRQTQIFMETPYRNNSLLADILQVCGDTLLLCIASQIGQKDEFIKTMTIGEWKRKTPDLHKKPSVFLLYSNY